jgi:hypothetical protein
MTPLIRWLLGFVTLLAVLALIGTATLWGGLRDNLIRACETSPITAILAENLRADIKSARGPGATVTHADFPDIPLARFRRLVQQSIERDRAQLTALENLDCESRY